MKWKACDLFEKISSLTCTIDRPNFFIPVFNRH